MVLVDDDGLIKLKKNFIKEVEDDLGNKQAVMESVCKHLDIGTNRCMIHDEETYPQRCEFFPRHEEALWLKVNPDCTMCEVAKKKKTKGGITGMAATRGSPI